MQTYLLSTLLCIFKCDYKCQWLVPRFCKHLISLKLHKQGHMYIVEVGMGAGGAVILTWKTKEGVYSILSHDNLKQNSSEYVKCR